MIPAEAVEAAAKAAMLEMAIKGNVMQPNDIARAVFEAAVPYLRAGYEDVFDEGIAAGRGERPAINPYRSEQ